MNTFYNQNSIDRLDISTQNWKECTVGVNFNPIPLIEELMAKGIVMILIIVTYFYHNLLF